MDWLKIKSSAHRRNRLVCVIVLAGAVAALLNLLKDDGREATDETAGQLLRCLSQSDLRCSGELLSLAPKVHEKGFEIKWVPHPDLSEHRIEVNGTTVTIELRVTECDGSIVDAEPVTYLDGTFVVVYRVTKSDVDLLDVEYRDRLSRGGGIDLDSTPWDEIIPAFRECVGDSVD